MGRFIPRSFTFSVLVATLLIFSGSANSQTLFQNNNQQCEFDLVECSTVTGGFPLFCENDATSIACRNISGDADFNGDGFTDCVVSSPGTANDSDGITTSVLINKGAGASACSPGPGSQFNASLDYVMSGLTNSALVIDIGTAIAGQLNGGGVSDWANPEVNSAPQPRHISSVLDPDFSTHPDESTFTTVDDDWEPAATDQAGFNMDRFGNGAERGTALLDCDNNGSLDAVIGVLQDNGNAIPEFDFRINILRNNGGGLQPIVGASDSFDTGFAFTDSPTSASLAIGDFNNDGSEDVIMAMQAFSGITGGSKVSVCLNDGNCGFTCSVQINLEDAHPNDADPFPSSVAAGDFDGDGNQDIVLVENGEDGSLSNPGVHYYFGNGDGTFVAMGLHIALTQPSQRIPKVVTTGCFNNDNIVDVAVSCDDGGSTFNASVDVVTSNGTRAPNAPLPLLISGTNGAFEMTGVDSADFDQQGGDDIIALGTGDNIGPNGFNGRAAFVFMNTVETLSAVAGADESTTLNVPITISGASCAASPVDPTDPAQFAVQWTLTPAAGATLTNGTTLTPTFNATVPGTYTLTLQCRSRCTSVVTSTKTVTVPFVPVPPPSLQLEGSGIFCALNPAADSSSLGGLVLAAGSLLGILGWARLRRRSH